MTSLVAFLLLLGAPLCPPASDWQGGAYMGTQDREPIRREHRDRFFLALHSLGFDREAREVALAIAWGESRWDGCAIHKLGPGEWGRGMVGSVVELQLRDKWGPGPEELLHIPEVAAVVLARMVRRNRRGSWLRVHRAQAGKWKAGDPYYRDRFCARLRARGVDCRAPVSRVGRKLGTRPGLWQWPWLAGALWRALWRRA